MLQRKELNPSSGKTKKKLSQLYLVHSMGWHVQFSSRKMGKKNFSTYKCSSIVISLFKGSSKQQLFRHGIVHVDQFRTCLHPCRSVRDMSLSMSNSKMDLCESMSNFLVVPLFNISKEEVSLGSWMPWLLQMCPTFFEPRLTLSCTQRHKHVELCHSIFYS